MNISCAWRQSLRINLRGFRLEQAGFEVETPYTIEVYDNSKKGALTELALNAL